MSEQTVSTIVVAFLASLPPTLAALAVLKHGKEVAKEAREAAGEVKKEQGEIKELVNGNMIDLKAELKIANARVAQLQKLVERLSGKIASSD